MSHYCMSLCNVLKAVECDASRRLSRDPHGADKIQSTHQPRSIHGDYTEDRRRPRLCEDKKKMIFITGIKLKPKYFPVGGDDGVSRPAGHG